MALSSRFSSLALIAGLAALGSLAGCSADGADFYESCAAASECSGAVEDCYEVAWIDGEAAPHRGGMCSQHCAVTAECPDLGRMGSACWELDGDPMVGQRICYQRCANNLDCDVGFLCADAVIGGAVVDSICLPR